jgi:hypothetical protein
VGQALVNKSLKGVAASLTIEEITRFEAVFFPLPFRSRGGSAELTTRRLETFANTVALALRRLVVGSLYRVPGSASV